jgi:ribosomal protein S27E
MTRQRWFRSSLTCGLKPVRHLENRIVFCNDCLANRTLWVSASGTLDCSLCGSQNWMHLAVPLTNRATLSPKHSPDVAAAQRARPSLTPGARASSVAQTAQTDREFVKRGPNLLSMEEVTAVANHLIGWVDSRSRTTVQSIHETSGCLRIALHSTVLLGQQVFWNRFCCIRNWFSPAKQT